MRLTTIMTWTLNCNSNSFSAELCILPGMSVKQPHCLITMAGLPTFASKAYSAAFELIQVCVENTHSKDS